MPKDQAAIRERANKLWDVAGKPEDDDFREEAERQLTQERVKHELKTPDNL
jgi:hypothetical protein